MILVIIAIIFLIIIAIVASIQYRIFHIYEPFDDLKETPNTLLEKLEFLKIKLKNDFDLDMTVSKMYQYDKPIEDYDKIVYFQTPDFKTYQVEIMSIRNAQMNKTLAQFNDDDIYNTIALAIINKITNFRESVASYYDIYLSNLDDNIRYFIYEKFATSISDMSSDGLSTENFKSKLSESLEVHKNNYDILIRKFLDYYIYSDFQSSNNPFFSLQSSFKSYLENIANGKDIELYDKYMKIVALIYSNIDTNNPKYNDTFEYQKVLFNMTSVMDNFETQFIIPKIIIILRENNGRCFIHNQDKINVNLRPCTMYLTTDKKSCDANNTLYQYSLLQLETILLYHNNKTTKNINIPKYGTLNVKLLDNVFLDIMLNSKNTQNSFKKHFESLIGTLNSEQYDVVMKIINDIIQAINTNIVHTGINYNPLDIYKMIKNKKSNSSTPLMCKITLDNLYEIKNIEGIPSSQSAEKVYGSCFYNIDETKENIDNVKKEIKDKFNMSPTCDTETLIENINCTGGCSQLKSNKFIAFSDKDFNFDINKIARFPNIYAIFMKISIKKINKSYKFSISFVNFNTSKKELEIVTDVNYLIRLSLYTLESVKFDLFLRPNNTSKVVYIFQFYDKKILNYYTKNINFSLKDFNISGINLSSLEFYHNIILQIFNMMDKKCEMNEDFNISLNCFNAHITDINMKIKAKTISELESYKIQINKINEEIKNSQHDQNKINNLKNELSELQKQKEFNEYSLDAWNKQERNFYIKPLETYKINSIDLYKDHLQKANTDLSEASVTKYITTLYDNQLLLSNDDCIYVKIS